MAGHLVADSSEWEHSSSIPRIVSQHEANTGTVLQLIRAVFNLLDWEVTTEDVSDVSFPTMFLNRVNASTAIGGII